MKTVSVVIATHNRLSELSALLADLTTQSYPPLEILVVDSMDGRDSSGIVARFDTPDIPVRHLLTENVLSTKRNHGAASATGDLLVILDDDLRVGGDFIESHAKAHWSSKFLVSGSISFPPEWVSTSNYYRFKSARHDQLPPGASVLPHRIVAMNHSLERSSYIEMGGYDEDYRMYGGEDIDFGLRASRIGISLLMEPRAKAVHHEVRMTWSTYLNKVHKASFYGLPIVLHKHKQACNIPTIRIVAHDKTHMAFKERCMARVLKALASRAVLERASRVLESSDRKRALYAPRVYMIISLIANHVGFAEYRQGKTYAPLFPA